MINPAVAGGLIIDRVGSGWVFVMNAASFVAVLWLAQPAAGRRALSRRRRAEGGPGGLRRRFPLRLATAGHAKAFFLMLFLIGTFGLNFPIFISTMSVAVFHADGGQYGVLTSMMAVGRP